MKRYNKVQQLNRFHCFRINISNLLKKEAIPIGPLLTAPRSEDQEYYKLPPHRRCACHLLNLVASVDALEALESTSFKKNFQSTMAKLRALFTKQSRSTVASDKIKDNLGTLSFKNHMPTITHIHIDLLIGCLLVIPNSTRWNSMFDAMRHIKKLIECEDTSKAEKERVAKMKTSFGVVCDALKVSKLSSQDYTLIGEYVTVMTPIAHALDVLQEESGNNVTSGNLLPTIVVIRNSFKAMRDKAELMLTESLLNALDNGLNKRFDSFFELEELQIASAVHPKFKLNWLDDESPRDRPLKNIIIARVESKLSDMFEVSADTIDGGKQTPDEPKDFYSSLKKKKIDSGSWKHDYSKFLEAKDTDNLSVLSEYPNIKKLYLQYNTGLPASAACERLFSLGARVLTPTRSLLSDKNFETLVFLKANKPVIEAE